MKIYILLLFITLQFFTASSYSQFTKSQIDELTAKGIFWAIEPDDRSVVNKTKDVTEDFKDKPFIHSIAAIFEHINRNWNYSRDPGGMEYFEKAGVSVHTYTGDCDDYATLMVSMVKALGGEGRIVCVSGHAYPELYLGKNLSAGDIEDLKDELNLYYEAKGSQRRVRYLNYHADGNGTFWLNLDYQDRYPGGSFVDYSPNAEHLVIYSDGSYELAYLNK